MNKILITIVATVVILVGAVFVVKTLVPSSTGKFGDTTNYNPLPYAPTNSSVLCATTPTLLLATSSAGRPFVSISNISAQGIYLGFNNTAALYQGMMIPASTTITLPQGSIPMNAIYCIGYANSSTSISAVN